MHGVTSICRFADQHRAILGNARRLPSRSGCDVIDHRGRVFNLPLEIRHLAQSRFEHSPQSFPRLSDGVIPPSPTVDEQGHCGRTRFRFDTVLDMQGVVPNDQSEDGLQRSEKSYRVPSTFGFGRCSVYRCRALNDFGFPAASQGTLRLRWVNLPAACIIGQSSICSEELLPQCVCTLHRSSKHLAQWFRAPVHT